MTVDPRFLLAIVLWGSLWGSNVGAEPARISGAPLVYIRSGPGPVYQPLGTLPEGQNVEMLERAGAWTKVQTKKGTIGFVYSSFVKEERPTHGEEVRLAEPTEEPATPPPPGAIPEEVPAGDEVALEIATLRSQIADLRTELLDRMGRGEPASGLPAPRVSADLPSKTAQTMPPASEPNVRTLATSVVSLMIGWVLGAIFARRRSRTQRSRLRF